MVNDGMYRPRKRNKRGLAYQTRLSRGNPDIDPKHWVMDINGSIEQLELATSARKRLRGLLFTDPDDITRLLIPCHDVHTYGMQHPLDIAFISRDGQVLEVHRNVETMRRLRRKDASLVAERFSKGGDWLKEGDVIKIGEA